MGVLHAVQRQRAGTNRKGANQHAGERTLAAATLPNNPKKFSSGDRHADVGNGMKFELLDREFLAHMGNLQQRPLIWQTVSLPTSAQPPAVPAYMVPLDDK